MTIRVAIADDALGRLLSAERDFEVVPRADAADVVVMDQCVDTIAVIAQRAPVVLLTNRLSDAEAVAALRLGAIGIVLKENAPRTLSQCVRTVATGEPWLDADAMHAPRTGKSAVANGLTRRELDIVRMVAVGARNKKIAEQLGIAEGTVKMHLHTIYEKLEISGRVELSIYAREHALV